MCIFFFAFAFCSVTWMFPVFQSALKVKVGETFLRMTRSTWSDLCQFGERYFEAGHPHFHSVDSTLLVWDFTSTSHLSFPWGYFWGHWPPGATWRSEGNCRQDFTGGGASWQDLRLHQGYRPFTQLDFCGTLAEKFLPFVLEFNGKWQLASLRCNRGEKPQQPISPSIGTDDQCRKKKEAHANHTIRHDLMRDRAAVSVRKKVGAGCGCCRLWRLQ